MPVRVKIEKEPLSFDAQLSNEACLQENAQAIEIIAAVIFQQILCYEIAGEELRHLAEIIIQQAQEEAHQAQHYA